MLQWQDGNDRFDIASLSRRYREAAMTATASVREMAFTGFIPISCNFSESGAYRGAPAV